MSSILGSLGGIAENSAGEALAFGLGFALGRALEPAGVELAQTAWSIAPDKVLDPGSASTIVAEALKDTAWGESEAKQTGIDAERFDLLVQEVLTAPGFAELLTMLRRGTIQPDAFAHGLRKAKLETEWDVPIADLQDERLDPAVIATSIQRGIMHDPGVLPVGPPAETGNVPPMPVSALDTLKEAAASGVNEDRLAVLARIVGLPASPDLAARMVFRGILERVDFDRAVAEGNTRNEWAPFLFEGFREILTAHDYVELRLRGWITDTQMYAGTALHGMSTADTDNLFKVLGRPITTHEVTTGTARGGTYNGPTTDIPTPFLKAMEESNLRPEWYSLHYANRYTYPSAFVLRTLAQSGELSHADVLQALLDIGWPPTFADKVATAWAPVTTAAVDANVKKAHTKAWTEAQNSYLAREATAADVKPILDAIGVVEASQTEVLAVWNEIRALVRKQLTPAQVKKAIGEPGKDKAWATQQLLDRGYDADDAATFLAE